MHVKIDRKLRLVIGEEDQIRAYILEERDLQSLKKDIEELENDHPRKNTSPEEPIKGTEDSGL